jgi:hypothetical protein
MIHVLVLIAALAAAACVPSPPAGCALSFELSAGGARTEGPVPGGPPLKGCDVTPGGPI